jgi:hypothetical protein
MHETAGKILDNSAINTVCAYYKPLEPGFSPEHTHKASSIGRFKIWPTHIGKNILKILAELKSCIPVSQRRRKPSKEGLREHFYNFT